MSTIDKTAARPVLEDVAPNSSSKTRRRASSRAGLSMLAHGEPMLWLTGGALGVCLLMIVGLLALVLWQGLNTFLPVSIVHLKLRDGTQLMGQVTRTERYRLNEQAIAQLSPAFKSAAREQLDESGVGYSRRRLLRTGNYDLTGTHFHWVSQYEIEPGSETTPAWAVLLERVTWGRFFGTPIAFTVSHPREADDEERQLADIVQFFQSHSFRLDDERAARLNAALKPIVHDLARVRARNVHTFVARVSSSAAASDVVTITDDGQQYPAAETPSDANVVEVQATWRGPAESWQQFLQYHEAVRDRFHDRVAVEKHELGQVNRQLERARLAVRQAELDYAAVLLSPANELLQLSNQLHAITQTLRDTNDQVAKIQALSGGDGELSKAAVELHSLLQREVSQQLAEPQRRYDSITKLTAESYPEGMGSIEDLLKINDRARDDSLAIQERIDQIKAANQRFQMTMKTAEGVEQIIPIAEIVRAVPANQLTAREKLGVYLSRWREFILDEPREANSEGGVMPAIWGTVAMTMIMSLVVVPFGVLAALYLREYAQAGFIVSAVRISINNLAGVPSIVFGVFGLGFFCYIIGGYLDGGSAVALPPARWWLVVVALALCAVAAFLVSLQGFRSRQNGRHGLARLLRPLGLTLWIASTACFVTILATTPYFKGFYQAHLPNPVLGTGGLLWAAMTLALLTLPVVIVATEEALSAVPNSLREGSYACGGSKWQTIRRIVLPHAMPGIMTGTILAMARGAGEVAPLMLVGAVKLAPELPIDGVFPFVHPQRSFMHLGFHIYDLGFQSQNSEAAKPMVFTTTLLLIVIIAVMNLLAIVLRARLKKQFQGGEF